MVIQLIKNQVSSINFQKIEDQDDFVDNKKKNSLDLAYSENYDTKELDVFAVVFNLKVEHEHEFKLEVQFMSWFKTSEPISDDFKNSDFPKVNAPAIAFPFLRSFVGTLTLNSGFDPALLPSINFSKLKKETEMRDKESKV